MRNADEAAQMESADGRTRYADAVTRGIVAYLIEGHVRVADVKLAV